MPGFSRLQKQVFYNLMTASKTDDDHNVRVNPVLAKYGDNTLLLARNRFRSTRPTSPDGQETNNIGSKSDFRFYRNNFYYINIFRATVNFSNLLNLKF